MQSTLLVLAFLVGVAALVSAQDDGYDEYVEKRAVPRNAMIRFGRSGLIRNAAVRFGKRSAPMYHDEAESLLEEKRNGAPQPFVRFGKRSGNLDHIHDIMSTLEKLQAANN